MTTIIIPMHWVRETKRTNRYEADGLTAARDAQGAVPPVDTIYLQKSALNGGTAPSKLVVRVEFD